MEGLNAYARRDLATVVSADANHTNHSSKEWDEKEADRTGYEVHNSKLRSIGSLHGRLILQNWK